MSSTAQSLVEAVKLHQAGQLDRAEEIYREVLTAEANHADALHLLGVCAAQRGDHKEAADFISRAIQSNPQDASCHGNLGTAFRGLHRFADAADCYRRALQIDPSSSENHSNLGAALAAMNQLDEAGASLRKAAQLNPSCAATYMQLGDVSRRQGNFVEAIDSFKRALQINPNSTGVHNDLGIVLKSQGELVAALESFRRAIEIKPDFAEAYNNLGNTLDALGENAEAVDAFLHAIQIKPDFAEAHNNLGSAHQARGDLEAAAMAYQRAFEINPNYAEAHNNLGIVHRDQGKLQEAEECSRRALQLRPEFCDAFFNLANTQQDLGKLDEAVASYRRTIELQPNYAAAFNNLGNTLLKQGALAESTDCFQQAIQLKSNYAEAFSNIANAFQKQGKLNEAEGYCRQALELEPNRANAHNTLGNVLKDQGHIEDAKSCFRQALIIQRDSAKTQSNLLLARQYEPRITLETLAAEHKKWNDQHAAPLKQTWMPFNTASDSNRTIRLGFVSADLGRHPVGYFLVQVLEMLDAENYVSVCYSDRLQTDEWTHRIKSAANHWHETASLSDESLAEKIRSDQIDILFDLAGHTAKNRLLVFARKPAPIQVTWAGYVGTTGLAAMDYLLADSYHVPVGCEKHFQETILRLPDGYVCFAPPSEHECPNQTIAPERHRRVVFGSFNNPCKVNADVVSVWAEILRQVDGSLLLLKYRGFDDAGNQRRVKEMFAGHDVDTDRIEFLGHSPRETLLATYDRIDIALDTFPYSGGLTTCEAIWMGVPVITCPGEAFASRHSLGHLSNVGLTETICESRAQYVQCAVELASDLERLAQMRCELRQRMADSPLCDGKAFTRNFENVCRQVWTDFCRAASKQ